ncbi:hypothetical protein D4R52_00825 [bacterium]|nr:MAG: hypothetical protein D4R52_00825 [bacterium]
MGFAYVSLKNLLKASDIVSLHVPYCKATHHLINKNNIKYIKRGGRLINTSRGGLIETEALYEAIKSERLAGAALDVLEDEFETVEKYKNPEKKFSAAKTEDVWLNKLLINMDNVIVTPHNAFDSIEALKRILDTTVDNLKAIAKGRPINKVN